MLLLLALLVVRLPWQSLLLLDSSVAAGGAATRAFVVAAAGCATRALVAVAVCAVTAALLLALLVVR